MALQSPPPAKPVLRPAGRRGPLFGKFKTDKKIGIGIGNHCNTIVEPPEHVAALIRKALEYIPPERLVVTTDCGFGRKGLSRRVAYYKCVSLVAAPISCAASWASAKPISAPPTPNSSSRPPASAEKPP